MLLVGLGLLALVLGYSIGGSATPVVGAVVPAIAGLLIPLSLAKLVPQSSALESSRTATQSRKRRWAIDAQRTGAALIVFSAAYFLGSVGGAKARLGGWLVPPVPEKVMPWDAAQPPPSLMIGFYWVTIQDKLLGWGYSQEHVQELYTRYYVDRKQAADNSPEQQKIDAQIQTLATSQEFPRAPESLVNQNKGAPYAGYSK